jgi:hypothetical protein
MRYNSIGFFRLEQHRLHSKMAIVVNIVAVCIRQNHLRTLAFNRRKMALAGVYVISARLLGCRKLRRIAAFWDTL